MKRALLVLAIIGCGPSDGISPPDSGVDPNIQLDVPPVVTVVVGESSTFDVAVSSFATSSPSLTITTGPLPDGVSCDTMFASANGTSHVTLTLHASADAAIAELPIDVRASSNGQILESAPLTIDVSAVVGSLDPTFGDAGILTLPSGADNPTAIGVTQDGTIVVTGTVAKEIFIDRFTPGTTPSAPYQYGTSVSDSSNAAIASDGRVAFGEDDATGENVVEVDATNTLIATQPIQGLPTALALDGSDLFVATTSPPLISRLGPSGTSTLANTMYITSLETTAPGSVLAAGADANNHPIVAGFTVNGTTFDAPPPIVLAPDEEQTTNTVTTAKGTLVGLAGTTGASVLRLDSQGSIIGTYALDARFSRATEVVALSSSEPVLLGMAELTSNSNVSTLVGSVVGFDVAFGALGHTYIMGVTTLVAGAIDPAGKYLYVTGTMSGTSQFQGWVARIRLTSTP